LRWVSEIDEARVELSIPSLNSGDAAQMSYASFAHHSQHTAWRIRRLTGNVPGRDGADRISSQLVDVDAHVSYCKSNLETLSSLGKRYWQGVVLSACQAALPRRAEGPSLFIALSLRCAYTS
jgi:hypothetical protein